MPDMRYCGRLLNLCLVGLVLLTALGLGVAKGQAPVVGHVVLCGSDAAVAVDASGTPVTAPGHCPDCFGLLAALSPPGPDGAGRPVRAQRLAVRVVAPRPLFTSAHHRCPPVRAPPASVWPV